jgi:para-nitrobenzyl esterase
MDITRRRFTTNASLLLAGGLVAPPIYYSGVRAQAPKLDPIVETTTGKVRGAFQNGVYSFKGIPYGDNTTGPNRWMPPVKLDPWAGVKDCLAWGPSCPQTTQDFSKVGADFQTYFGANPDVPTMQSEDCLVLNIFTPGLGAAKKRPVMFWIHGGGYNIGSGSGSRSNGTHLAQHQDVVQVSVNHRLGVLGYLNLGALNKDFDHAANVGQLDLIAALEWVRDNIDKFGGDPTKIMIHGESGGGGKVSILMGMPAAKGLFHRAICQSGVAARLPAAQTQAGVASSFLFEMNSDPSQLHRLQSTPASRVIAAAERVVAKAPPTAPRSFSPSVGDADLPTAPLDAIAAGSARIPLIVGCTKYEARLFIAAQGIDPKKLTDEQLQTIAKGAFGDKAGDIISGYKANYPSASPGDILVRAQSDTTRINSIRLAEAHIKGGGAPTYMYLYAWETPVLPALAAGHGSDSTFYFDNIDTVGIAQGNAQAKALATKASAAWASFARLGKPAAPGLPVWPEYTVATRATMVFDGAPHVEMDPMKADRMMREKIA